MSRLSRFSASLLLPIVLISATSDHVRAQFSWDGGGGNFLWGTFANWNPDGDPNFDPVSIGDLPSAANDSTLLNASFSIDSLTLSNGADVINSSDGGNVSNFDLVVNGATIMSNAGTSITIYGGTPNGFDTNTLTINSGGRPDP